jgi:hypothetical protein
LFRIAENSDGETNDIGCDSTWISSTTYTVPSISPADASQDTWS